MSRQARRAAQRAQAKATPPPEDQVPLGIVLAGEVPVHERGDWPLRDGWVSKRDAAAWHEVAHTILWLHFGHRVPSVTLEGFDSEEGASGELHADAGVAETLLGRQLAAMIFAGPYAVRWIRRDALRLPHRLAEEQFSERDRRVFDDAERFAGSAAALSHAEDEAAAVLFARRNAFGAMVRALLEHTTLDDGQIMAVWCEATQ